jgi:amidase
MESALELAETFRVGRRSVPDVIGEVLERLSEAASTVGGVAALDPARTLAEAAESDRRLQAGESRILEGVPFTVKDWIDVAGWPIRGELPLGSAERRPEVDASTVARLRAAGAIVVGISSTLAENRWHGRTRNPHDLSRAPGGSSSGAAALVAAGAVPLALGSDSGGSIRLPAAWCGVAGLKPSFGRVPLTGHFPRCGSLEDGRTVIGPIARTVADLAAILPIIAGADGRDAGVVPMPLGPVDEVEISSLRVLVADDPVVRPAVDALVSAGASIVHEPLADVRDEALELTRRYWSRSSLSGQENVRVLWDWDRFRRRLLVAMAGADVVLTPAVTEVAPPWRESVDTDYVWTLPWSLTGSPVVVVPVGFADGLPVAVQVVGQMWRDDVALAAARCIEADVC